jgi:hypothetical protein
MLTFALTLSASAGEMLGGVTAPPPPATEQAMTQGDMSAGVTGDMPTGITATNPATDALLTLLQTLLSLF